ncbi:MAG TPA: GNAT family N-acetyltransferase [Candidatus Limnocylindrales bacterium]|nr:GNAT family N-acetyltransferase [Candidatus Limnocylindrales bacterium]
MSPDRREALATAAFTIRPILPSDYPAVARITLDAYEGNRDHLDDGYRNELQDVAARAGACPLLVAVGQDGTLLGGVTYVPGPDNPMSELEKEGEAGIRMLAVHPSAQGLGVGRALTLACLERARREGRSGVALYTRPANVPAQRLYASLGFERDAERDWQYARGQWLWAYQLRF